MNKKRFSIILSVIIFLYFSPYLIPKILYNLSLFFRNSNGQFDLSIFWTAILGIATFTISIVSFWQTNLFKKRDYILNYKVQLLNIAEEHEEKDNWINTSYIFRPRVVNYFVFKKDNSSKCLTLKIKFNTINQNMPNRFFVKSIRLNPDNIHENVLTNDWIFKSDYATITDYGINEFKCRLEIIDENIEELVGSKFSLMLEILFFNDICDGTIETEYLYCTHIEFLNYNDEIRCFDITAKYNDIFLIEKWSRFVRQKN
ncbi:hypothetical protein [Acetobacterium woodii]|uniref:Uncharacterized protein n=1 Tax=Acetobacterium woodii (strain ATCC 29683 / DSM 1030 / JCM 2381 / KCTC 1655 / WB1) TaxID=931626 RepID=H6LIX6_ACEWD|nr:hypothetical protein [Acetobacterium woodii]AFA49865.1 hypothetical protein Awo_c31370 [Acetobacterium woodii DSM 1030]